VFKFNTRPVKGHKPPRLSERRLLWSLTRSAYTTTIITNNTYFAVSLPSHRSSHLNLHYRPFLSPFAAVSTRQLLDNEIQDAWRKRGRHAHPIHRHFVNSPKDLALTTREEVQMPVL